MKKTILLICLVALFLLLPPIAIFCVRYFELSSGETFAISLPIVVFEVGVVMWFFENGLFKKD